MSRSNKWALIGAALVMGLLVSLSASSLLAQQPYNLEIRGGTALPAGDLADAEDVGGSLGVGFGYWLNRWVGLRLDSDLDILPGASVTGGNIPDMTLWHYNAGVEVSALESMDTPWKLWVNLGVGATTLDTDDFVGPQGTQDITQTYFAMNGGIKLGYDINPSWAVWVGSQTYITFGDDSDTQALAALSPSLASFSTDLTVPVTAGVRYNF